MNKAIKVKGQKNNDETLKTTFCEVELGYTEEEALLEASRCLNCKNAPCVKGCPLHNDIPKFINEIKNKNYSAAASVLELTSGFSNICSRVCYSEHQCEKNCTRGIKGESIAINLLERFASQYMEYPVNNPSKSSVGIVGSGPASLGCALELAKNNYQVTIYEKNSLIGGWLNYGIPKYRLPKSEVDNIYQKLLKLGVKVNLNNEIKDLKSLLEVHKYLFLGIGLQKPHHFQVISDNDDHIIDWCELLRNPDKYQEQFSSKRIAIVGGGNVAIDCARTAIRLNAKAINIIYRRTIDQMPANDLEIIDAQNEGVVINELLLPDSYSNNILSMTKMKLTETINKGRREVEPTNETISMTFDYVVGAIGQELELTTLLDDITIERGLIVVDQLGHTNIQGVYAGGDVVTGAKTVVEALSMGKTISQTIINDDTH